MRVFLSLVAAACLLWAPVSAQQTIKVHFLYGSKPAKGYEKLEKRWFGGLKGGHVGIEIGADSILSFLPSGEFHLIDKGKDRASRFTILPGRWFWGIFGTEPSAVKKLSVTIPINERQRRLLDSIAVAYTNQTPYDYALVGMRCGSAATDILARLGILHRDLRGKGAKIDVFYPKILRTELLEMAKKYNWELARQEGTPRRTWEKG